MVHPLAMKKRLSASLPSEQDATSNHLALRVFDAASPPRAKKAKTESFTKSLPKAKVERRVSDDYSIDIVPRGDTRIAILQPSPESAKGGFIFTSPSDSRRSSPQYQRKVSAEHASASVPTISMTSNITASQGRSTRTSVITPTDFISPHESLSTWNVPSVPDLPFRLPNRVTMPPILTMPPLQSPNMPASTPEVAHVSVQTRPPVPSSAAHQRRTSYDAIIPAKNNVTTTINNDRPIECYFGERNEIGQRHGKGLMKYSNGCRYNGYFLHDKRNGFGKCWYPNGCIYTGLWRNGKRDGNGIMTYLNGDIYEGEWEMDRRHGRGTYFYRGSGCADVCVYMNNEPIGDGTQWSPCRQSVRRLVNGKNEGYISAEAGLVINATKVGLEGRPKRMLATPISEQTQTLRKYSSRV